jgi:aspartate aminotransferase
VSESGERAKVVASNLANVARGIYSMPPDHGAAIAGYIMQNEELRSLWEQELDAMRHRLNGLRVLLVGKLEERGSPLDFSFIARERGMFSFLGLEKDLVVQLREKFHVYMVESSRINIAGINRSNVDYVADSIVSILS